ncbi:autotransporter outer membrane beta-barrel domain-containing protein [Stenotrophomonas sp. Ker107b]
MITRTPSRLNRLRPLSLAIAATWACSGPVLAQSLGPVVADGHPLDVISGSYASADDGAAGYVFHARNGGSIGSGGPVSLTATGANTAAARAESAGTLIFAAGDITTSGASAVGLSVATGGRIELQADAGGQGTRVATSGRGSTAAQVDSGTLVMGNTTLETTGSGSHGLVATGTAQVEMVGGRIQTSGDRSHAVMADNGVVTLRDARIQTGASYSDGLYALNGGRIEGDNVQVSTAADGSAGARVAGGATLSLINSDLHVAGEYAMGVELSGGTLRIENSALRSDHERGDGVYLRANSRADIIGTTITAGGYGININGDFSDVRLSDVEITANRRNGIWMPSASTLTMLRGSITTSGDGAVGIDNREGIATLDGLTMRTGGASAHGLYASYDTGGTQPLFEADGVDVTTTGAGSIAAIARLGGTVHLRDSTLLTTGAKGYGVLSGGPGELTLRDTHVRTQGLEAYAGVVNANGRLDIDGGSLISERHAALWVRTAREVSARNGAQLIGGNGTLMNVDAAFSGPFELHLDQDVYAQGDIAITPEDIAAGVPVLADIRVRLNGRSHWVGATTAVNQVALSDNSRWTLTGDASVGQLNLQDSTLALSAAGSTSFNRLTVSGDVEANNALLIFNGALGDDTSLIDFLHVRGDTRGSAGIQVNNVHGLGAQTSNGIQLIQVDGRSDAAYTLNGRAVAGSYDYFLHKGGVTTPGDGGWYLRSALTPTPSDPCDLDPTGPGCVIVPPPEPCEADPTGPGCVIAPPPEPCEADPTGPGCGIVPPDPCEAAEGDTACDRPPPPQIVRPEAGAYLANQAAAVSLFQHRLQDRNGADGMDEVRGAGWLRVSSSQTRQDVAGQLALTGRATVLMGGLDVLHWGGASQGSAGVLLAAGQASTDVRSRLSGYAATGTVKGGALGIYATWLQRPAEGTGAYADGWVQHGRYRNTVQGIGLAKERQDAQTQAASVETGYAWAMRMRSGTQLMVQPQLQLTYTDYRADRITEHNGTQVAVGAAGGLSSRLGVRLSGDVRTEERRVQPFVAAHWLHEGGGNRIWMDDALIEGAVPKNRYEVRGGAMLQLGTRWSAWGDLGLQRGDAGYRSVSAQLGLNARW